MMKKNTIGSTTQSFAELPFWPLSLPALHKKKVAQKAMDL